MIPTPRSALLACIARAAAGGLAFGQSYDIPSRPFREST